MLQLILMLPLLLLPALDCQALQSGSSSSSGSGSGSLLEGLTQLMLHSDNQTTTLCEQQLLSLHEAWQRHEAWALKAFDASGSGYANMLMGDALFLGSRITCRAVNHNVLKYYTTSQRHLLHSLAPFAFDYRVVYVRAGTRFQLRLLSEQSQLLHIGLCVPQSCERTELDQLLRQTLALHQLEQLELQPQLVYSKQPQLQGEFVNSLAFRLLIASLLLVLVATLLGTWLKPKRFSRLLDCFDAHRNWERLQATEKEISVINGLRVLGAVSMLVLHVTWYTSTSVNQTADMATTIASIWLHHPYMPAMLEVFFTISGFLTVLNFMSSPKRDQCNLQTFLKSLLQRYLRLVPMQLVLMLVLTVSISYYREVSLFHLNQPLDEHCHDNWWQNILLLQNMFPTVCVCANWTWSLACEMQFHVLAMLLLHLYVRRPRLVRRLTVGILVANLIYTFALIIIMKLKLMFDVMYQEMGTIFYFNPLVRLQTYVIGAIYAYTLRNGNNDKDGTSRLTPFERMFPGRITKALLTVAVVWITLQVQRETNDENTLLIAAGVIMIRIIISCLTAHFIFVSFDLERSSYVIQLLVRVLQANCFQLLGKLTFTFYLIHPVLIFCFNYSFSNLLPSDFSILFIISIAYTIVSFALAFVLTLFFEMPFNRLSNLLLSSIRTATVPNKNQ